MAAPSDRSLIPRWTANAEAWTRAVRDGRIPSRRAGTDAAIVEAVLDGLPPSGRVLDLGCGEGWLARALHVLGAEVHGVDACEPLVRVAREAGGGTFEVLGYAEAADDPDRLGGPYDAVVFNFALLDESIGGVLRAAAKRLESGGRVVIQTVHPLTVEPPYADGWREERYADFGGDFEPTPWFFRTLGSWVRALDAVGLRIADVREPTPEAGGVPLSLVLVAEPV